MTDRPAFLDQDFAVVPAVADVNQQVAGEFSHDLSAVGIYYAMLAASPYPNAAAELKVYISDLEQRLKDAEEVISKQQDALSPLADVFNDNGDMTVDIPHVGSDDCIKAYFAKRTAAKWMEKSNEDADR